jgi:hypothetical protein
MKNASNEKLGFRIRKDTDDDLEFQKGIKVYHKHLDAFKKTSNSDLWKYFYWDFFHDGRIESISMGKDFKSITMKLTCPNIKRFSSKTEYKYLNADFTCTFQNVLNFEIENTATANQWLRSKNQSVTFLYAEINSSPLLKRLKPGEYSEYYSLLIQLLTDNYIAWLEIVFSQVDVEPKEPLAFSLMESNPKFEIPAYYPKKK